MSVLSNAAGEPRQAGPGAGLRRGYDVVRVAAGALLLAAAALKAHQLATEPVAGRDLLSHRWSLILQTELELVFALVLLSGVYRRVAWLAAVVLFGFFAAVTLHKGLAGEVNCGCFGTIQIHPWYMLAVDLAVLTGLLVFRPELKAKRRQARVGLRLAVVAAVSLAAGVPAGVAMAGYQPARLLADGTISGGRQLVVLEPRTWVARPWPLRAHVDIGQRLSEGRWVVILYHHDCPSCRQSIPDFEALAGDMAAGGLGVRTAMIELPPYGLPGTCLVSAAAPVTLGKLSDRRDWFVETPVMIALQGGVVAAAVEGRLDAALALDWAQRTATTDSRAHRAGRATSVPASKPSVGRLARRPDVKAAAGATIAKKAATSRPKAATRPSALVSTSAKIKEHDLGYVEPESKHTVVFAVDNPGPKPIEIRKVRSECKCMGVPKPPAALAAGECTKVTVSFKAPAETLRYSKRILLMTKDPGRPVIALRLKADVGLPVAAEPASVDLGQVGAGENRWGTLKLVNRGKRPVRPIYATSTSDHVIAEIPRATIAPGKSLAISVRICGCGQATGSRRGTLSIHINHPKQRRVDVRFRLKVADGQSAKEVQR